MKLFKVPKHFYKKITKTETVSPKKIDSFVKRINVTHKVLATVGFLFGLRLCDVFLYDEQDYLEVREQQEAAYWAHHGRPKNITPDLLPCQSRFKQGELCETWIAIKFEKDKYIRKIDPAELQTLNN